MTFFKNFMLKRRLRKVDPKSVGKYSLKGTRTYGRVCKVYDGDTITIIVEKDKRMIKYSCRILGIDTPELRTQNKKEKEMALIARDYLRKRILNKVVLIEFFDFDKYGRVLASVFYKNEDISVMMIKNTFAVPYFGGKRQGW